MCVGGYFNLDKTQIFHDKDQIFERMEFQHGKYTLLCMKLANAQNITLDIVFSYFLCILW